MAGSVCVCVCVLLLLLFLCVCFIGAMLLLKSIIKCFFMAIAISKIVQIFYAPFYDWNQYIFLYIV